MTSPDENILKANIDQTFFLLKEGRSEEARGLFTTLLDVLPHIKNISVKADIGELCICFSELNTAKTLFMEAVETKPDNPVYCGLLGRSLLMKGEQQAAKKYLQKALALNPEQVKSSTDLATAMMECKEHTDALEVLRPALKLAPDNTEVHRLLARCFSSLGRSEESIFHALKTIAIDPSNPHLPLLHYIIGRGFSESGKPVEAGLHFEQAIQCNSCYGIAYHGLAQTKKFTEADASLIQQAEQVLTGSLATVDRFFIHFALGKIYDDLKKWNLAFDHYQRGNALRRPPQASLPNYELFSQLKNTFTKERLATLSPLANLSTTPIFIVGMPRSGSTLVEQILSSHPQVAGAGELSGINSISTAICPDDQSQHYQESFEKILQGIELQKRGNDYLDFLHNKCLDAQYITDKEPSNYRLLGLIHFLFPNAIIIHTVRHPLDTGLSCYFQPFDNIDWSTDLRWIAQEYCFYREAMDYWRQVLPAGKIIDVEYEQLLGNPEAVIRNFIERCGLEWNAACLDFHQQSRTVRTASLSQVRQPLYQTSRMRWVSYAPYLQKLATGIESYLNPEDKSVFTKQPVEIPQADSLWQHIKNSLKKPKKN